MPGELVGPVGPVEPAEIVDLLRAHHVKGLNEHDQRVLLGRAAGNGHASIADALGYSEGKVRRDFERLEDIILVPLGLDRDVASVTLWAVFHYSCCLKIARELVEKRIVFQPENRIGNG